MVRINGNRRNWMVCGAALALVPLLGSLPNGAGLLSAGEKNPAVNQTKTTAKSKGAAAVSQAALAARLSLRGEKARSPILMLAAAELLSGLREGKGKSKPSASTSADAKTPAAPESGKKASQLTIADLVDKARDYARGDKELSALIEKRAERLASRGLVFSQGASKKSIRIKGSTFKIISSGLIRPGYRLTLTNVRFEGRKPARVLVVGDGDGDLDLYVYDGENSGALLRKDTDRSSTCVVSWTPRYTGPFKVVVRNVGRVTEKYYVLANW